MNISEGSELDINTEDEQNDRTIFLQESAIKIIGAGDLFPVEMLMVYKALRHDLTVPKNDMIEQYRSEFEKMYHACSEGQLERLVMNALVTICEFLNGNFEKGIQNYIQRLIISDTRKLTRDYTWAFYYKTFLTTAQVPIEIVVDSIKDLLNWKRFETLSPVERRSIFVWILHEIWHIESYFLNTKWLELYDPLKKLSDELLCREMIEEQMYVHFFTYHIYGNNIHTQEQWKRFTQEFDQPESEIFREYAIKAKLPVAKGSVSKGPIKIILVKDRIVNNSVFQVEYSLFKALMIDENFVEKYELSVLSMTYYDKSEDGKEEIKKLQELGVKVIQPGGEVHGNGVYYYNHLKKAEIIREHIVLEGIDIMIVDASCFDISNFLFATRSAPKQLFWSHGNYQYDSIGIDKKIGHYLPSDLLEERSSFVSFDIPYSGDGLNPTVDMSTVEDIRSRWPKEWTILGVIGRLVKVDSLPYLEAIISVMKKNDKTIFLACGAGNTESIKQKIVALDEAMLDRFYFLGHIDPHLYGHVIDIFPDTFPLKQGNSKVEVASKGVAVISLNNKSSIKRYNSEKFVEFKEIIEGAIGKECSPIISVECYKKMLTALIRDRGLRQRLGAYRKKITRQGYCDTTIESFLTVLNDT